MAVGVVASTVPSSVKSHAYFSLPWSAGSGSVDPVASNCTVSGALPDLGVATSDAVGGWLPGKYRIRCTAPPPMST